MARNVAKDVEVMQDQFGARGDAAVVGVGVLRIDVVGIDRDHHVAPAGQDLGDIVVAEIAADRLEAVRFAVRATALATGGVSRRRAGGVTTVLEQQHRESPGRHPRARRFQRIADHAEDIHVDRIGVGAAAVVIDVQGARNRFIPVIDRGADLEGAGDVGIGCSSREARGGRLGHDKLVALRCGATAAGQDTQQQDAGKRAARDGRQAAKRMHATAEQAPCHAFRGFRQLA